MLAHILSIPKASFELGLRVHMDESTYGLALISHSTQNQNDNPFSTNHSSPSAYTTQEMDPLLYHVVPQAIPLPSISLVQAG